MVNVRGDGNCGYHALMAALDYIDRKCKGTVKEVRRDIWEFAMNHKYYLEKKFEIWRIYRENLTCTVYTGKNIG